MDVRNPGEYTITYDVSDSSGNQSDQAKVVSVRDSQRPVLALIGDVEVEIEVGKEYSDAGATASDAFKKEINRRHPG